MNRKLVELRWRWTLFGLVVLPHLPEWMQRRCYWWFAPPGIRKKMQANARRAVFRAFAEGLEPDNARQ